VIAFTIKIITLMILFLYTGLQEVGSEAWGRAEPSWNEPHTRPIVLPQLCADLVWLYETRGRPHEDTVVGPFPRPHQGTGPTVELLGLRKSFQLSFGIPHESTA
jgi:hypothetical protein